MRPGRMFRHSFGLHKREPQQDIGNGGQSLPSSIGNPAATLPPTIATDVTAAPSETVAIVTASALSGLTTITETQLVAQSVTGQGISTTITTERIRTITNSAEYASLTSAEALSASTTLETTASKASAPATSSAAAANASSNLSTLIPAIVVPIAVVLLASLGAFWFFMRRRHRRELQSQPEFVMAGKGEKLSSRSSSARSNTSDGWEKKSPAITQKEPPSTRSPPTGASEWPSPHIGVARPLTPQESKPAPPRLFDQPRPGPAPPESRPYRNFSGPGPRPATAGRPGLPPSNRDHETYRNRSNSTPGQRGQPPPSRSGPSPVQRSAPSPVPRGGPSPIPSHLSPVKSPLRLPSNPRGPAAAPPPGPPGAFRFRDPSPNMNMNTRAQAPSRLEAPPPGAYNGASSISQYSPIVKDTPNAPKGVATVGVKRAPPPINTSNLSNTKGVQTPGSGSPPGNVLTEENLRIARFANSSRLGYTPAEPSPSPKLPPPATRSQLIPRESPKEAHDRFFAGSGPTQSVPQSRVASITIPSHTAGSDRASIVSDPDDYEDIDAKSDVSSLNEFERFDFGAEVTSSRGSGGGGSLNYFATQNSPATGRGSPFGNGATHERW